MTIIKPVNNKGISMGWENIRLFLSKIDINQNNIIEQSEIEAFKKANPDISLNGVAAGMTVGDEMEGLYVEKTSTKQAEPKTDTKIDKESDVFHKEEYFPYLLANNGIQKITDYTQLRTGSHQDIKDARNCDISALNLTKEQLLNLCIDNTTVLSDEQKQIIAQYTEKMKNPGLGIKTLHEQGITGKGLKIAIIDQPLGEHQEYSSNIIHLEDINSQEMGWTQAQLHGAAVASIAVGKTTGVAPDADLVYFSAVNLTDNEEEIAEYHQNIQAKIEEFKQIPGKEDLIKEFQALLEPNPNIQNIIEQLKEKREKTTDAEEIAFISQQIKELEKEARRVSSNNSYAEAINKVLDMNKKLPECEKIPVISISWGFNPDAAGYDRLEAAVERAKKEGVFIVSTALAQQYGMETCGANRDPQADPDAPDSYEAGAFWKKYSETGTPQQLKDKFLLIPMDHRTVADYKSKDGYRYEGNDGGMSWSTPWLAGMYVLAKQVKPSVTPQEFWDTALKTSDKCTNNDTGTYVGRLINPQKLIEALKN